MKVNKKAEFFATAQRIELIPEHLRLCTFPPKDCRKAGVKQTALRPQTKYRTVNKLKELQINVESLLKDSDIYSAHDYKIELLGFFLGLSK